MSVKDVQAFLGFANFYRRFIPEFSKKVKPLNELTKGTQYTTRSGNRKIKYGTFDWTTTCQQAFEDLKRAFTTAPVLAHYDLKLETWVETNASDFVVAGVLSQMHGEVLKPVAYFSKKMTPAECNYMIYDKELLAIVKSFKTWRPELASVQNELVKMLTNHRNLEHFMTTKQLNRRQARWAEFLSEFNFKISYRPGKKGKKPDTLTRLSQDKPKGVDDSRSQQQFQTLLKGDQLDDDIKKALAVIFRANKVDEVDGVDEHEIDEVDEVDEDENKNIVDVRDYTGLDLHQHSNLQQNLELCSSSTKNGSKFSSGNSLIELLSKAYQNDEAVNSIIAAKRADLRKLPADLAKQGIKFAMGDLTLEGDDRVGGTRLYVKSKMYVPDDEKLRLFLLQQHHDPPIQDHPGHKAMLQKLLENWYWLGIPRDCKRYAMNCSVYRRTKAYNTKKQRPLNPLPIPNQKWTDLSLDFVINLPDCQRQNRTFRHILVMVDRLTKQRLYEPLKTLHTEKFLDAMQQRVFSAHGYPMSIVNDRGGQMTSTLWRKLCERYGIRIKFSSAQHPETDGQTENANKVMKNYLRAYVSHTQGDWVDHLPMAEFSANNHVNESTGMTSFFADNSFHPRTGVEPPQACTRSRKAELLAADRIIANQEKTLSHLQDQLTWTQEEQAYWANQNRQPHPEYEVGDMVYVDARHFASEQDSKSLSMKNAGP